jgi:hypothetical protein
MPALLTSTSMRPDRPSTSSAARVTETSSSTSSVTGRIGSFSDAIAWVSSVAPGRVAHAGVDVVPEPREVHGRREADAGTAAGDQDDGHVTLPTE